MLNKILTSVIDLIKSKHQSHLRIQEITDILKSKQLAQLQN